MRRLSDKITVIQGRLRLFPVSLKTALLITSISLIIISNSNKTFEAITNYSFFPNFSRRQLTKAIQCSNCYDDICTRFQTIANCAKLLEAKGDRHKLPKLDLKQNFYDLRNVLLIIHFNGEWYSPAPLVDSIYQKIFANIIYCGPSGNDKLFRENWLASQPGANVSQVQFVSYGKFKAQHQINPYRCLPLALNEIREFYYDGVLLASDDAVLNYWNWKMLNMSLNDIWAFPSMTKDNEEYAFDINSGKFCSGKDVNNSVDCTDYRWMWSRYNNKEMIAFYDELTALANGTKQFATPIVYGPTRNSSEWTDYWRKIKANLTAVTKGDNRMLSSIADVFYVGRRFLPTISPLLDLLGRHHVFLEIAVKTAIRAVASIDEIHRINDEAEDWGQGQIRSHPFIESYSTSYVMVHPFKMSKLPQTLNNVTSDSHADDLSACCVFCNLINLATDYSHFINSD